MLAFIKILVKIFLNTKDEVAYFSHPFEFHVYYCNDEINMNYKGKKHNHIELNNISFF
jgi:hypothetical protein